MMERRWFLGLLLAPLVAPLVKLLPKAKVGVVNMTGATKLFFGTDPAFEGKWMMVEIFDDPETGQSVLHVEDWETVERKRHAEG